MSKWSNERTLFWFLIAAAVAIAAAAILLPR
jgi:hypothetical protein